MIVHADAPPVITKDKIINKPVATEKIDLPSNKSTELQTYLLLQIIWVEKVGARPEGGILK